MESKGDINIANNQVTNYLKNNFIFISNFMDEIYEIFTSKYYIGEFLINFFFILFIIIITIILYWDNINTRVSINSRCKKQLDVIDKAKGIYRIDAKDKNDNALFNIKYILGAKRNSVECECKDGDVVNTFRDIPIRDLQNNKDTNVTKTCMCDRYYDIGIDGKNIMYSGEPGILRYMDTKQDTMFFDTYYNNQFNK